MKTLFIIRHAKSSWDDPFQDDFDRPLNERGRRDAPRMGKRLKERDIHPDLLLSSPAERALSTCLLIAEILEVPAASIRTDHRLYHASDEEMLQVIHQLHDNNDAVIVFSHNPGLTELVNRLNHKPITDNVPTCGMVCLKFPTSSWKDVSWGKGKVVFYDYPKKD